MIIRHEEPSDAPGVRAVNEAAFGSVAEANLVEALHRAGAAVVSLVAELNGEVVGHILFSKVTLEKGSSERIAALGPMSVRPALQSRGVGTQLAIEGLAACARAGSAAVVVLGHPRYYPRFGFRPAGEFGLRCEYDVPADVFMALELTPGALNECAGVVRYHPAFADSEER